MTRLLQPHRNVFSSFVASLTLILCVTMFAHPVFAGWARLYGDSSKQEIYDSVQTPDGGYLLVGATKLEASPNSALVIKLNSLGNIVWARFYGIQNQVFKSIIPLPNGNYLIAGKTEFFGTPDCLLVEVDGNGNVVALRTYGGSGSDACFAVARTPGGDFILAGRSDSAGAGNFDAWLLKIDSSYNLVWSKLYGTPPVAGASGIEELYALVTTAENFPIAVGKTHSFTANDSADVLALRVDGSGNILWTSVFNGFLGADGWWDVAHDIIFLADGSVMLTGFAWMSDSYDLLLLQLNADTGEALFNATYGDASTHDKGQSLVETPSGELVIAGTVGGATGWRALFTNLDASRDVTSANVLGPAASAYEWATSLLDVASYFVSGNSSGYVPNGDAMGVKVNDSVTIAGCADLTATTLNRGPGVTPRPSTVVTTNFSVTPNSYFLNTAPLTLSETTICTDEAVSGPDINVVPPSHNYGTVLVGQSADKVFRVSNDGNPPLNIGAVTTPAAPFSRVADACSSAVLAPTQTCDITIRYAPTAAGNHNSSFQIPSDDPDENPFTVNLSGTGALAAPDITVTPASWDFGSVNVGSQADKIIQVKNDGTANLTIGAVTSPAAPFSRVADACSSAILAPTQTCDITIRFAPTGIGPSAGNFNIPSDDPDEPSVNVSLSGNGVAPDIDPDPPSLDFGVVRINSSQTLTLTLRNTGNRALVIGPYSLSPPFSIQNDTCWARVLAPFSSCTMDIQFLPQIGGEVLVSFAISFDDPDENPLTVPLRGIGISPPTLLAPPNDVYVSDQPVFRMTTNPLGIATLHYRVEISTDNFASLVAIYDQMGSPAGWSQPQYAPGETAELVAPFSLSAGDYQWRALVHYHNEGAFSDYTEVRSFRVPASPTLLSPAPYEGVPSRPTFTMTWNNPGTPTTLHYILEILDGGAINVLRTYDQRTSSEGWSQPQYAPGETATFQIPTTDPLPEETYFWRVRVFLDDFGALSPPSLPTSFRVALPEITGLFPLPLINSAVRTLGISGNDLIPGATVKLVCTDCADPDLGDIPGTVLTHSGPFYIQAEFDLTNTAIVGGYNLVVTNPSGDEARQAVLIQPFISFPYIEPGGVQGIAVVPETFPHHGTNVSCMMVYNFSNGSFPDVSYFLIEMDLANLPQSVRFLVGYDYDEGRYERALADDKTKAVVLLPLYPSGFGCVPAGGGISPEKVIYPDGSSPQGFLPSNGDDLVIFGEDKQLSWKGVGSAAKEQVKGMIVDTLISMACGGIADALFGDENLRNLKKAVSDVVDGLPSGFAKTPKWIMEQVAGALVGLIPGVGWAQKFAGCMGQILDGFFYAFDSAAKGAADRLRARHGGNVIEALGDAIDQALRNGGHTLYSGYAALLVNQKLNEPVCSPPPSYNGGGSYTVRGPWDPNDKETNTPFPCERVTDENGLPQCARYFIPMANASDPIEYVIRFENKAEATAPAVNVVITDVLDSDLDPATLNVIISSHPAVFQDPEINGQTVIFRFNGINLPPNVNPPEGEGSVRFTVRPRAGLPVGTEIRNKASIVFDFNPPIETPEVVHILGLADLSVTPSAHNFGTVSVAGGSSSRQFNVTNVGGQPLRITSVVIAGADAAHFRTQNDTCSAQTLDFNASCTVEVVFAPTSPGTKSAVLRIASNDADTPTLDVPLTGTGEGPSVTAARGPASLPATAQKGALRVPVLQFRLTAGAAENISLEGLTLQAGGDGNDQTDILAIRLFVDSDADGTVDPGEVELWSGQYGADNGTATVAIAPRPIPANGSETYLVTYDFAQQIARVNPSSAPPTYLATGGTALPVRHRRGSLPAPLLPVAAILLVTLSLAGFRRLAPRSSLLTLILLLALGFSLLTSCNGGGPKPAATRSYQATLTSLLAKGASTNLQASITGTPVSGPSISIAK